MSAVTPRRLAGLGLALLLASRLVSRPGGAPPDRTVEGGCVLGVVARGMNGPIRAAVSLRGDRIEAVAILSTRDGWLRPFEDEGAWLGRFAGLPARPPLAIDAVAGATVSCSALARAIEARLREVRPGDHR